MNPEKKSVTVIGAGIVGISCAVYLQRAGCRVTVIDRLPPGEGASFGNAGLIATGAVVPVATPGILRKVPKMLLDPSGPLSIRWSYLPRLLPWLYQFLRNSTAERVAYISGALGQLLSASVEEHQRLAAGTGAEPWVRPAAYLCAYKNDVEFAADAYSWRLRRQRGIRYQLLRGAEAREFEPALAPDYQCLVVVEDHGYTPDPERLVKALAAHFVENGGVLLRREVRDIEIGPAGPTRLLTDDGALDLEFLVVAAGAWSGRLAERLGSPVPLESERGYHVTIRNPGVVPRHPIMVTSGKFVATPMAPGLRLAGMVEFGGLDAPASSRPPRILLEHARRLFPGIDTGDVSEWMGRRPSLPDSLPVIGRSPHYANVFFAFGHQHIGLTSGPKTGRLIADLITGRRPNVDLEPFRVDRFGGK